MCAPLMIEWYEEAGQTRECQTHMTEMEVPNHLRNHAPEI